MEVTDVDYYEDTMKDYPTVPSAVFSFADRFDYEFANLVQEVISGLIDHGFNNVKIAMQFTNPSDD